MTQSSLTYYPSDDFDQKTLEETLFSPLEDFDLFEELHLYPIRQFLKYSYQAQAKRDILVKAFHSNILRASDSSIEDPKKWMKKEKGASVTSQIVAALDGSSDWEEKEESLRKKNPQILKWNTEKGDPTKPVELEEADCFLCMFILDLISKSLDDFHSNIKKIASMLGVGKRFFLCGLFNCTRFTAANELYHVLPYDEIMVREALQEAGIFVLNLEKQESKVKSDAVKCDYVYFVEAIKFSDDITISE